MKDLVNITSRPFQSTSVSQSLGNSLPIPNSDNDISSTYLRN
jgi:hypothetical protein